MTVPALSLSREPLCPQFHFTARYWGEYTLNPQAHQEGWINALWTGAPGRG